MKELKPADIKPREPPRILCYAIWWSGGKDGLEAFKEAFENGVKEFGYWPTVLWAVRQWTKSVPYIVWGALLKLFGIW